jgi:hypothetical protein
MYLHKKGVHIQTAPYTAAAQLDYMFRTGYIDAVQGSASCFSFGASQIILGFNWDEQMATWIDLPRCLTKLELTLEHFHNACLLSGASILPVLPGTEADPNTSPIVHARNLLRTANFNLNTLLPQEGPRTLFQSARTALAHAPYRKDDGEVELANSKTNFIDMHDVISQRLPDELYFYLSRGLIGPRVLSWRSRQEIVETPPLDGGFSTAYKRLVQIDLRPLRTETLAILTKCLNRYYQRKNVNLVCWFQDTNSAELDTSEVVDPTTNADDWNVKQPPPQEGFQTPLMSAIHALSNDADAKKTAAKRGSEPISEKRAIQLNVVWRFLQHRGYIAKDHTLTAWGKALRAALNHAGMSTGDKPPDATPTEVEEAIFMSFELLRFNLLDSKALFPVPPASGGPLRGSESDKMQTFLISRVACLGYLNHKSIGYTGPLSRYLLAYHQCAAAIRGALRDLLETHACHLFLSNAVDRKLEVKTYTDVAASLPLVEEPDIGLALIVKCYLDELCQPPDKRSNPFAWFPHAVDIPEDLEKVWRLWGAVSIINDINVSYADHVVGQRRSPSS